MFWYSPAALLYDTPRELEGVLQLDDAPNLPGLEMHLVRDADGLRGVWLDEYGQRLLARPAGLA